MCPEKNKDSVVKVGKAKKKEQIDDFVFYDSSTKYLIPKLLYL